MVSRYADIARRAMALPTAKRAQLAERLIRSLDPPSQVSQKEVDDAWAVEIKRRVRAVDEGRMKTLPGKQVLRRLRAGTRK